MAGKKGMGKTVKGNTRGKKQTKKKQSKSNKNMFKDSLFIHCSIWVLLFVFTGLFPELPQRLPSLSCPLLQSGSSPGCRYPERR